MSSVTMSTTVPAPVSAVSAPGADADRGAALRAARAERGVLRGRRRQPLGAPRDQVLHRYQAVVRGEEAGQAADRLPRICPGPALRAPGLLRAPVCCGPLGPPRGFRRW